MQKRHNKPLSELKSFKAFAAATLIGMTTPMANTESMPAYPSTSTVQQTRKTITTSSHRKLLDAIRQVETGGEPKNGEGAIGDNGNALGPYQIWKHYWKDAVEYDKSIGGSYEDCAKKDYSEKIVVAYWNRYAPANASFEVLARIHNGGPSGFKKSSTIGYWNKVKSKLGI